MIRVSTIVMTIFLILISFSYLNAEEKYSLDDLYRLALERAERIKISGEDLFISERGKDKALSLLLPKLSTFGSYTRYTEDKVTSTDMVIQPGKAASWGLRLDQSFSLSGSELTAFKIAKKNIEKSKYDFYAVKEDYLLSVSSSYYDVLRARKAVDIAKANVERLTKHRNAASIRLKVGEVTKTALLRAEAELTGAQSEQIKAENGLELSKAVLVRIVGIKGDYDLKEETNDSQYKANIQGTETSPFNEPTSINGKEETVALLREEAALQAKEDEPILVKTGELEALKQTALSERAELKGLEVQKKIGEEQVKYAKGAYWPNLSIEGVYLRRDEEPASLFLNEESIYGGIKLNFPFFEGGLRRAEVREAEAKHRQSILIYDDRKKAIDVEVENAYLDLITQKGIMEKFETHLIFAKDNYNAVTKQFEFGLANSIDVMDANTLLVTSERQLADARYNYQLSVLSLKRATGTLLKTVASKDSGAENQNKSIGAIER